MYASLHSPQIIVALCYHALDVALVGHAVCHTYGGYVVGIDHLKRYKTPSETTIYLAVAFLLLTDTALDAFLQILRSAEHYAAAVFQCVVQADEEVKHLV